MPDIINGRYELLKEIGQGGYGAVYEAHDLNLNRRVAVKQLHALGFKEKVKERFLEEARISSQLHHNSALLIYDFGVNEFGDPYLVSELLKGISLQEYLQDHTCTLAETVELLMELSEALGEAHDLGIIHRDIKPSNLFIHQSTAMKGRNKTVIKLLDFGIAKVLQNDSSDSTKTGAILGTPAYISPEQIKDSSTVTSL